ncbi:hypothetical protein AVEN_196425-1 [Araneus ventricosus]|uniref:Mutator-like transposase domain-containing protein n=1 Tax=Araneus ventricosus TaxID=182803 RepID=A0A4Y2AWE8_ARAVE|nr:hypothetical protein AVEN_196425-1 [Araneus ventricosus]
MFSVVHSKVKSAYDVNDSLNIDISVTYVATWLTCQYKSLLGIGIVVDVLTGYLVAFEIMCKVCRFCSNAADELGKDSAKFNIWYEGHRNECIINRTGSFGSMELKAAEVLWKCSTLLGFSYTAVLSDGDSKIYQHLSELKVYGDNVKISKEKCVNHVSKRLETALQNSVKEWRARGMTLGGKKTWKPE